MAFFHGPVWWSGVPLAAALGVTLWDVQEAARAGWLPVAQRPLPVLTHVEGHASVWGGESAVRVFCPVHWVKVYGFEVPTRAKGRQLLRAMVSVRLLATTEGL